MYNKGILKKSLICLLIILTLAVFLRTYQLDKVPSSLFGDEVDVGYQAYSLLKTGQDLKGNSWPILVQSFTEYRAPLFIYSSIPFIAVFGLNEWGVRLPVVFWGILGVLGAYFLTKKLLNNNVALLTVLTLSLSPWHIQYSRAAFEVTMLFSFFIWGTYFFLKRGYYLIFVALLFALTPYIYSTAVVFMPLLTIILLIIYQKEIRKDIPKAAIALIIMILILLPFIYQTLSGNAGERFGKISIFSNQELSDKVLLSQQADPGVQSKIFHNKPLIWLQYFTQNYLRSFSPEFLFLSGDPNFRHSIHEMGEQYFYELILLLMGIWVSIKSNFKNKWLILGWILIAPIPAALTYDGGFHATRTFTMLLPLSIFIALGADFLISNFQKSIFKYLKIFFLVLIIFNVSFYLHRYFTHYPAESWRAWHDGFKESLLFTKSIENRYERVYFNNTYEPMLSRFLFWYAYDPNLFHKQFSGFDYNINEESGFRGFKIGEKYYFGEVPQPYQKLVSKNNLLVASVRDDIKLPEWLEDPNVKLLKTVYSPSHEPIFYVLTGNEIQEK